MQEIIARLEEPLMIKSHHFNEIASILKCISNKKMILPQSQFSKLTNRLLDLSQQFAIARIKVEDLELVELMYFLNCYRRYDYPEHLTDGFLTLSNKLLDDYLETDQPIPLVDMEFCRLINGVISFHQ